MGQKDWCLKVASSTESKVKRYLYFIIKIIIKKIVMSKLTETDLLQKAVNETSGTALTISPKEGKWTGYLLQQKLNFEAETLPELCQAMTAKIIENRVAVPVVEGKKQGKVFKYQTA
jgi:hypothetical protein